MGKNPVLLVEDDYFTAQLYVELLKEMDFETITCPDIESGEQKIKECADYSLVIIDVMLPGESKIFNLSTAETRAGFRAGQALARYVKSKYPQIKILLISSVPDYDIKDWCQDQQIRFLSKSSENNSFKKIIADILNVKIEKKPKVFIVHGHDEKCLLELKDFLQNTLHFPEPIILREQPSCGKTIIENLEEFSRIDIVFVLLTPDDVPAKEDDSNDQKRRARQNVIFETGLFYGKLGRKSGKVLLLKKGDLELPSDISGIIYVDIQSGIESAGEKIRRELNQWL